MKYVALLIEEFYMLLLYQNNNRIKKSKMSIGLNLCLVNCANSLFVWIIYVYCSGFIFERLPKAKKNYSEYFLLTRGDT
jgi:hypothetical protein